MDKESNKSTKTQIEGNLKSKPKKAVPVVRQTKTSLNRMLKANPLLRLDKSSLPILQKGQNLISYQPQVTFTELKKSTQNHVSKTNNLPNKTKRSLFPGKNNDTKNIAKSTRKPLVELEQRVDKKRVFKSEKSVSNNANCKIDKTEKIDKFDKIDKSDKIDKKIDKTDKNEVFKTPSAYARRSVAPLASSTSCRKSLHSKPQSISKHDLQRRLSEWLQKRGKSLSSFHHIKCFGVLCDRSKPSPKHFPEPTDPADSECFDEENKENIEVDIPEKGSYEDLRIKIDEEEAAPMENVDNVAKAALIDLHKLIMDGYPLDQCEGWLNLIKEKSRELDDEYQYWECRAAIEQMRGDITKAVDCYQEAIVKGAEIKAVDESLDQLLQKFSLLHINPTDKSMSDKERERIVREARNVFKSSIIKFAVQEKKIKKHDECDKKFILTPVRRSTRLSRSVCNTPVRIVESIEELEVHFRQNVEFKKNIALK